MRWKLFFEKLLGSFFSGATASVGQNLSTSGDITSPPALLQHSITGAIVALLTGLSNYLKHKDD